MTTRFTARAPLPHQLHLHQEWKGDKMVADAKAAKIFVPLHRLSSNASDQGAGGQQESFTVSREGNLQLTTIDQRLSD